MGKPLLYELEDTENEIQRLTRKKAKLLEKKKQMTPEKELAELLHHKFCGDNHIDQCDWEYDDGTWTRYSRSHYLRQATNIINLITKSFALPKDDLQKTFAFSFVKDLIGLL